MTGEQTGAPAGQLAALAARVAELERALGARTRQLHALETIGAALGTTLDPDALMGLIVERIPPLLDAERSTLFLLDPESGELWSKSAQLPELRELRIPRRAGLVGWVVEHGLPLRIPDAYADPRFDGSIDRATGFHTRAVLAVPLRDREGEIVGALQVLNKRADAPTDEFTADDEALLTALGAQAQLALSKAQLARADRLATLGSTLAGILHDFRTPMAIIHGYVQLVAREPQETSRANYCREVARQIDGLNAMTREVLAFTRGERTLLARRVGVGRLMGELAETLRAQLEARGITVELRLGYDGLAYLDEYKVQRLVLNLARNAGEAMSDGGVFRIEVDGVVAEGGPEAGVLLTLRFTDTGPGIPAEVERRLFESFVTRGKSDGTGLGLAIVKGVVEAHGGTITVSTRRAPPTGTTFVVTLPTAEPGHGAPQS